MAVLNLKKNIRSLLQYTYLFALVLFYFVAFPTYSHAQEIQLNLVPIQNSEDSLKLSLNVVDARKIAGIKVTFAFNKDQLTFLKAEKTKHTSSFLHVVNDKVPGKVIVVMASAKGVSGQELPLVHLIFSKNTLNSTSKDSSMKISVTQVELMDENLKELSANTPIYGD